MVTKGVAGAGRVEVEDEAIVSVGVGVVVNAVVYTSFSLWHLEIMLVVQTHLLTFTLMHTHGRNIFSIFMNLSCLCPSINPCIRLSISKPRYSTIFQSVSLWAPPHSWPSSPALFIHSLTRSLVLGQQGEGLVNGKEWE